MGRYADVEEKLAQLGKNTRSSSSAPAFKKYIDPAMEENMRKTRDRNKKTALEQIQAGIKENFSPPKPVKTLSECNTYQDWRESVNRWTLMCGGGSPLPTVFGITRTIPKKE